MKDYFVQLGNKFLDYFVQLSKVLAITFNNNLVFFNVNETMLVFFNVILVINY